MSRSAAQFDKTRRWILLGVAALTALVACDNDPTTPRPLPLCGRSITADITVGPGPTPTFEWSPTCGVTFLDVRKAETDEPVWGIFALGTRIAPGVTYGTVPDGAFQGNPEAPPALQTGTSYVVILTVAEILAGEYEVGREEFTR